jgi:hypothetical protein
METLHIFEEAGLGHAPYKFMGLYSLPSPLIAETNPDMYNLMLEEIPHTTLGGAGTCSYCGMPIMNLYIIQSLDKETFFVGSECVLKTGDKGLINLAKRAANEVVTDKRHSKESIAIEVLRSALNEKEVQEYLDTLPHPKGWEGQTFMDYADWMFRHSGNAGKMKLLKELNKLLEGKKL